MRARLSLILLWLGTRSLTSQTPPQIDWSADDASRIAFVRAHSQPYAAPGLILLAPTDSVDPAWFHFFADSLATAVTQLRALIGGPLPWQRIGSRPVVIVLAPGRFVSHATGQDTVLIALLRARDGSAPYLHEIAHELLAPPAPFFPFEYPDTLLGDQQAAHFPFWLSEGLPDYLAQSIAARTGFREGDVFAVGGLVRVDSTCRARLTGHPRRPAIAAKLGRSGRLEALFTAERSTVAPTYYACSQSFTKYVVTRVGLPAVIQLFPEIPTHRWTGLLEAQAGESLETMRHDWFDRLRIPEDGEP